MSSVSSVKSVKSVKSDKLMTGKSMKEDYMSSSSSKDEDETTILLSELLSLNRAAHVLSRSGGLLDKLLKLDQSESCDKLIRDYELSSVMILIKHEDDDHEEGFKKIKEIEKDKKDKDEKNKDEKNKDEKSITTGTTGTTGELQSSSKNHHSTVDPLRIALYCKNISRPPRVGRIVRMVESERDRGDKYIIELIK